MKTLKYVAMTCLALVAGCAPEVSRWTPAESPKKNIINRAIFTHHIAFPSGATKMSEKEKRKLLQFLKKSIVSPSAVTVILDDYGKSNSEARIKGVQRELLIFGIPYELISVEEDGESQRVYPHGACEKRSPQSGVEVTIERYVVIPPRCADFSHPNEWSQKYLSSNFGCSDEANLGLMVANPLDLVRGRELGDSSGAVMAAGVDRYLKDKVKKLHIEDTTNIASTTTTETTSTGTSTGTY